MLQVELAVAPGPLEIIGGGARRCPGCSGIMHSYRYQYTSQILLDCWPECGGIWVQEGELAQMLEYVSDTHPTQSPAAKARLVRTGAATDVVDHRAVELLIEALAARRS